MHAHMVRISITVHLGTFHLLSKLDIGDVAHLEYVCGCGMLISLRTRYTHCSE